MNGNEFLNLSTNAQIANALLVIAIFLAVIALKKDSSHNSRKPHK